MQEHNDEQQPMIIGGNLTEALAGKYHLSLGEVFKQTFTVTKSHWAPLFLGFLAFFGILLILTLVAFNLLPEAWVNQVIPTESNPQVGQNGLLVLSLIGSAVGAPFWGGLVLMGIRHSVDIPTKAADVFDGFSRAGALIITLLTTSVITQLALLLTGQIHWLISVLAQIYFSVIFAFALPLVIERAITPLNAIYYSVRIVHYKLPLFVILLFVVTGLIIISSFAFFLPLIIVVPLIFNLVGVVYKEVVGVTIKLDKTQSLDDDQTPWSA
ncbi:hypothetical protein [Idiomarina sp.]|uniref:hypothetical protein n=1 Tax=Idiomarina sp. TaxID=1874361 RepID=UPI0025C2948C|nr:hypothetical protein [Idiomarina sp.]